MKCPNGPSGGQIDHLRPPLLIGEPRQGKLVRLQLDKRARRGREPLSEAGPWYDLFLGIPVHLVPAVVAESGLIEDGWIPVDTATLATRYPGVYALGDVASAPVPKAGVFAESAARAVAAHLIDRVTHGDTFTPFDGRGACYAEFGGGQVGRVDADFLTGPTPTGPFAAASRSPHDELWIQGINAPPWCAREEALVHIREGAR